MFKSHLFIILLVFFTVVSSAQQTATSGFQWYNPSADAKVELAKAMLRAKKEHKHILVQVGGNWCIWCKRLHSLLDSDVAIHSYLDSNFVLMPLNYSKENKNLDLLKQLGYPQRFGFPVILVLDDRGIRLHTQNSAYLEDGKGHSPARVLEFLKHWSPKALEAGNYEQ